MTIKLLLECHRVARGADINEDALLQLLENSGKKTVFDFDWSSPGDFSHDLNVLLALNGLCRDSNNTVEANPDILKNIPLFKGKPRTPDEQRKLMAFITNQYMMISANTLKDPSDRLQGIWLFQSLLNHSCLPNVDCIPFENELIVIASRPIEAYEQIFCYYGMESDMRYSTWYHQEMLKNLPFKCECIACARHYPLKFPRKDRDFKHPKNEKMTPTLVVLQFKYNCRYINANSKLLPSYEVQNMMFHNSHLLRMLTEVTVSKLLFPTIP